MSELRRFPREFTTVLASSGQALRGACACGADLVEAEVVVGHDGLTLFRGPAWWCEKVKSSETAGCGSVFRASQTSNL